MTKLLKVALSPNHTCVFVTPSHQFPLGATMSLQRRLALLDWAKRADADVLEDAYDSEYRFAGRPCPCCKPSMMLMLGCWAGDLHWHL